MQLFYVSFAYSLCCMVYDIVDTTKMIDCFYDVIDRSTLGSYADGVGLEDVTCLLFCETTAFDTIGIVGQINLCAMIDASVQLCFFLVSQSKEQRAWLCFGFVGKWCFRRDIPCLHRQECSFDFPSAQ